MTTARVQAGRRPPVTGAGAARPSPFLARSPSRTSAGVSLQAAIFRRSFPMRTRRIGDIEVSAIGLGGMPMSIEGRPEESRSIATVHAALDAGVTLIDTADAYCLNAGEVGHNESLIAKAL